MIGVIIPAHNEETLVEHCLASVLVASRHAELGGEDVGIFVALDRCSDGTERIVRSMGCIAVNGDFGNVGLARAAAAQSAINAGARWLACTDADSRVPPNWLAAQINTGADAFCGIVDVEDWEDFDPAVVTAFRGPSNPVDGHPHVHGANLGCCTGWYQKCGGFQPLPAHEDVALIAMLSRSGAYIARHASPVVITSARRIARAPEGFSVYLRELEEQTLGLCRTISKQNS